MSTYGKFNPGTYWGKGYGLGDLGEIATSKSEPKSEPVISSDKIESSENPLELIRHLSSSTSSRTSDSGYSSSDRSSAVKLTPASAALLSTALKQGANMTGLDPRISSFIPALTSAMSGDTSRALRNASGAATGVALNALDVPAPIIGPVASFVSSYLGGDKGSKIAENVENAIVGSALAYLGGPVVGTLYSLSRMAGFNPARGINNLINPDTTVPESWRGGFIDKGYETQPESYITSGNENYSPYGGEQYNRVSDSRPETVEASGESESYSPFGNALSASISPVSTYTPADDTYFGGINTGGGNNYSSPLAAYYQSSSSSAPAYTPSNNTYFGGINTGGGNNYYSSSTSSRSGDSGSSYGYSNPASSYGGW